MKIAINTCYGGFSLSEAAFEHIIALGVPVRKYVEQEWDPAIGRYKPQPLNEGLVIFDQALSPEDQLQKSTMRLCGRYWWAMDRDEVRVHPFVLSAIEALGDRANGKHAKLKIVEIPDDVDWEIDEYDGNETVREKSRSWG